MEREGDLQLQCHWRGRNQPVSWNDDCADGTMFSTAPDGGAYNGGVIFSMKKTSKGWKQTVIHSINFPSEGGFPYEGLLRDEAGNLYGAAPAGGTSQAGVIYRLSLTKKGWVDKVL